jgi:hypothetical protein
MPLPVQFAWGSELQKDGSISPDSGVDYAKDGEGYTYTHYHDFYASDQQQSIFIKCPSKFQTPVRAILSDRIKVSGGAAWSDMVSGILGAVPGGSALFGMSDLLSKVAGSENVRQPWMSRQMWQGSKPLELTIPLRFVYMDGLHGGAEYEVYRPACRVMSLCYPRMVANSGTAADPMSGIYVMPGPNPLAALTDMATASATTTDTGDPFYLQIGSFIIWTCCYATDVSIDWSSVLDYGGYPMSADVSLTVKTFEAPFSIDAGLAATGDEGGPIGDGSGEFRLNNLFISGGKVGIRNAIELMNNMATAWHDAVNKIVS